MSPPNAATSSTTASNGRRVSINREVQERLVHSNTSPAGSSSPPSATRSTSPPPRSILKRSREEDDNEGLDEKRRRLFECLSTALGGSASRTVISALYAVLCKLFDVLYTGPYFVRTNWNLKNGFAIDPEKELKRISEAYAEMHPKIDHAIKWLRRVQNNDRGLAHLLGEYREAPLLALLTWARFRVGGARSRAGVVTVHFPYGMEEADMRFQNTATRDVFPYMKKFFKNLDEDSQKKAIDLFKECVDAERRRPNAKQDEIAKLNLALVSAQAEAQRFKNCNAAWEIEVSEAWEIEMRESKVALDLANEEASKAKQEASESKVALDLANEEASKARQQASKSKADLDLANLANQEVQTALVLAERKASESKAELERAMTDADESADLADRQSQTIKELQAQLDETKARLAKVKDESVKAHQMVMFFYAEPTATRSVTERKYWHKRCKQAQDS